MRLRNRARATVAVWTAALVACLSAAALASTLAPAVADNVDDVFAFPVPWAPNRASVADGTLAGGITFTNLPVEGTVKIYSLSGRLVRTLSINPGTLLLRWDGRTESGADAVSGIYIWRVQSGSNGKSGKLVVIR